MPLHSNTDNVNTEKVMRHLEMIQGVVNRLADNSFKLKGWSIALVSAVMIFLTKENITSFSVLLFILPIGGFWTLDGYFLWQERLFREVYNAQRVMNSTEFKMNPIEFNKGKNTQLRTTFSQTLILFYLMEIVILAILCCLYS